jgi:glycosyltransferase involved in cell wall biosynthesis
VASSGLGHVARGIEAWASDLGWALARRGVSVTLCKGGGTPEAAFERVIPCWQRDAAKTRLLLRCLPRRGSWRLGLGSPVGVEQTTFAPGLLRFLRRAEIDILHVQEPHVARIVQWAHRRGWVRTRAVLGHGTEESLDYLGQFTYLQHLAPWHLEEARAAGVWKPTWTAIPNFIDTDTFRPGRSDPLRAELGIPPEGLVVLTVAAVKRHHKRIDYLLDEFADLIRKQPDLPAWLVVAGGWESETDELVAAGRSLLGDRVRFLVRFPRPRMPELYRLADAFVLCSLKEMMPIALLEATASALPCLVNRHPVVEWMIGPGGEAIDMATPGVLADALQGLLRQGTRRQRLGELARQHCLEDFGRDRVVDQILDYYQFILSHDRPVQARGPEEIPAELAK